MASTFFLLLASLLTDPLRLEGSDVPVSKSKESDARALLAITELMQCQLLSPPTIEYLKEVRDMLQAELMRTEPEEAA